MNHLGTSELPLDDLAEFPGNPRRTDLTELKASLARYGQFRALVVRPVTANQLIIVAGNHTAKAMRELAGLTDEQLAEHYPKWPQARQWAGVTSARCELNEMDDAEAAHINLADNRLGEIGSYDEPALAEALLAQDGDLPPGFDEGYLNALLLRTDTMGDMAGAFLGAPDHNPANKIGGAVGPPMAADGFVLVSWLVPEAGREAIRDAVGAARQLHHLETAAEAIVAVAADWTASHRPVIAYRIGDENYDPADVVIVRQDGANA